MHPLIPYLRRDGRRPLATMLLRRIEAALNEAEALQAENADLKAQLDAATAPPPPAQKGRKESVA